MVTTGAVFALGLTMRLMSRRGHTGLGEILLELARARSAAASERERRATTVEILDRLPHGGRVDEVDDSGRQRTYEVTPARARSRRKGGRQ
ncbi:hypothetical protein [Streptomyces sp. H51]|uniref:hypothetical protein n=1 Tax=Streptomyces sp. H51 TaxID=3111770 RepID=UPI002D789AD3|nr:hypothetical protein [Streptomyces sp. H51]